MTEHNGVMMQYFHWYTPADGSLWRQLTEEAGKLAQAGFTAVWLPPAYKGAGGGNDVGYAVYDHFDLGEFDQKGSVRTKYGTRDEYLHAIRAAQEAGLQVYADIVLNHKLGGDQEEEFRATPYNPNDRNEVIGEERTIKAWTHFTFPGRNRKYSELVWHWWHFNAADHNALDADTRAVYLFDGKRFDDGVDRGLGNFDYLLGCNLDINSEDVQKELLHWGEWYLDTTGIDGFRFDAVKHVRSTFFLDWLKHMQAYSDRPLFAVGEYWSGETPALKSFLKATDDHMMLFDVNLHYNFSRAGKGGKHYDLRIIFDNTLVKDHPDQAVTLVKNHDTQPLQALESAVEAWFKPLAYALILLRKEGYPCVFAADYYGARYKDIGKNGLEQEIEVASHRWLIDHFLAVRRQHAFGEQTDYLDDANCIGWTRRGNREHPKGMAVLLSNDAEGVKRMQTGSPETTYTDITGHIQDQITTDQKGCAEFRCLPASVSVWVPV